MKKLALLLLLAACLCLTCSALADELFVSPDGMSLTDALAVAQSGDVITLADGVYEEPRETFPITATCAVTLRAAQDAHPVINAPPFVAALYLDADQVVIGGLDIRFRRTGIYALGDDLTVEDCQISLADEAWRTSSCGMWMGGIYGATITDCAFVECSIAMAGPPLSETSHLVPVLTGMFEVGEDIGFFTTHSIERCTVNGKPLFYAVDQAQVVAPENAGQVIIANCECAVVDRVDVSRGSMGMQILYCDQVEITRCKADECGVFGIYLAKLKSGSVRHSSTQGTNHGFDIRASENIVVENCQANACDQGIFLSAVQRGLVRNCQVTSTGQGYFFASGAHCQIDSCSAVDCENGMNIQKEQDMLITNCTLTGNTICAARLDGSPTTFVNNVLVDNWVAIMAYGEVPFIIADNRIENSGSCGLYLRDIAFSRISGNTFSGSQGSSLQATGEMSGTMLTGNVLDVPIESENGAVLRDHGQ